MGDEQNYYVAGLDGGGGGRRSVDRWGAGGGLGVDACWGRIVDVGGWIVRIVGDEMVRVRRARLTVEGERKGEREGKASKKR